MENIFAAALKDAGFKVENEFVPWERFADVRLPFGSCVGTSDYDTGSTLYRDELNACNFYRKNATPFDISDFSIRINDYVTDFLRKNESKCRVMPKSSMRKVSNGNLGLHSSFDENEYEEDAKYGMADVVCYFEYSTQYEVFLFHFSATSLNFKDEEQNRLKKELSRLFDAEVLYGSGLSNKNKKELFDYCVENIFPVCEFIPIKVSEYDGCMLSHKAYKSLFGYEREVTSPCLGKNIKKHEGYMEKLSSWLANGGYIKDDMFYLIIEDRKSEGHPLYLRPWKVEI